MSERGSGRGPIFTIKASVLGLRPVCCLGMAPPSSTPLRRKRGEPPPPAAYNKHFCRPVQPGGGAMQLRCMVSIKTLPLLGRALFCRGGMWGEAVSLAMA